MGGLNKNPILSLLQVIFKILLVFSKNCTFWTSSSS